MIYVILLDHGKDASGWPRAYAMKTMAIKIIPSPISKYLLEFFISIPY